MKIISKIKRSIDAGLKERVKEDLVSSKKAKQYLKKRGYTSYKRGYKTFLRKLPKRKR